MKEQQDTSFIFAHDVFLGFPVDDPYWQDFFQKHNIVVKPYDDIDQMIVDLHQDYVTAAFLPAGGYYYLRNDPYEGIVSAGLGKDQLTDETAYLIVRKESDIETLENLRQKNFAYINHECTTSFLGLNIYLSQHHLSYKNFVKKMIAVKGFKGQVDAMSGVSEVDATMLWDVYWLENKALQEKTKIIGKVSELPTPPVIFNSAIGEQLKTAFTHQLLNYKPNTSWKYSGFVPFKKEKNLQFFDKIPK